MFGPASAGLVGTARLRYDMWGPDVLVANLMESSGVPGKIAVSERAAAVLHAAIPDLRLVHHKDVDVREQACGHCGSVCPASACRCVRSYQVLRLRSCWSFREYPTVLAVTHAPPTVCCAHWGVGLWGFLHAGSGLVRPQVKAVGKVKCFLVQDPGLAGPASGSGAERGPLFRGRASLPYMDLTHLSN
jgi:hypothetical protein